MDRHMGSVVNTNTCLDQEWIKSFVCVLVNGKQ